MSIIQWPELYKAATMKAEHEGWGSCQTSTNGCQGHYQRDPWNIAAFWTFHYKDQTEPREWLEAYDFMKHADDGYPSERGLK